MYPDVLFLLLQYFFSNGSVISGQKVSRKSLSSSRLNSRSLDMNHRQSTDAKERKRQQNRVAQRTYRQNQKQRIRALEGALAQSFNRGTPSSLMAGTKALLSDLDEHATEEQMWDLSMNNNFHSSDSSLDFSQLLDLHSPQEESQAAKGSFDQPVDFSTLPEDQSCDTVTSRTALHRAVSNKNESMVQLLLEKGADLSKKDYKGQTALHVAVESGLEGMVKLLLERKKCDVKDSVGRTALFSAVKAGNEAVMKLLLNSEIDVNCRDLIGETALHVAVENGSESLAILLLKHGADINA